MNVVMNVVVKVAKLKTQDEIILTTNRGGKK